MGARKDKHLAWKKAHNQARSETADHTHQMCKTVDAMISSESHMWQYRIVQIVYASERPEGDVIVRVSPELNSLPLGYLCFGARAMQINKSVQRGVAVRIQIMLHSRDLRHYMDIPHFLSKGTLANSLQDRQKELSDVRRMQEDQLNWHKEKKSSTATTETPVMQSFVYGHTDQKSTCLIGWITRQWSAQGEHKQLALYVTDSGKLLRPDSDS